MPFRLAIFDEPTLSGDWWQIGKVLRMITECEVLNVICGGTEKIPAHLQEFAVRGYILGVWPCLDDEESVIGNILAYHKVLAQDALYVGSAPSSIYRARKAKVATLCFGDTHHSPIKETQPDYFIHSLMDTLSIIRAQIPS
jgi:hypothetical protein